MCKCTPIFILTVYDVSIYRWNLRVAFPEYKYLIHGVMKFMEYIVSRANSFPPFAVFTFCFWALSYMALQWYRSSHPTGVPVTSPSSLTINVEHHFPHGRPHWLMEAKPDLSASAQRVVVALRGGEEGSSDRRVPNEDRRGQQRWHKG